MDTIEELEMQMEKTKMDINYCQAKIMNYWNNYVGNTKDAEIYFVRILDNAKTKISVFYIIEDLLHKMQNLENNNIKYDIYAGRCLFNSQ